MESLERQFSEGLKLTTSGHEAVVREYSSDPLPVDLLIEIFSRVPLKSIARFRCVSKLWASIFRRPDFTRLFLTKSLTRPRLLFTVNGDDDKLLFYSLPQPHNPDDNSRLVATPYPMYCTELFLYSFCRTVYGLVLLEGWRTNDGVICNPATGELLTLPNLLPKEENLPNSNPNYSKACTYMYFGYDPVGKQFKVLCMTSSRDERRNTHQVLTFESGKCVWRKVQHKFHFEATNSIDTDICINGILYFGAASGECCMIVCFDVRSEKFVFINTNEDIEQEVSCLVGCLELFNYKDKLGIHLKEDSPCRDRLVLWVLEDAGNHNWSKHVYVLSPLDVEMVECTKFVGMTGTGEIVYSSYPYHPVNRYYVVFYNMERKTFKTVKIEGLEQVKKCQFINPFIDHVENLEFM